MIWMLGEFFPLPSDPLLHLLLCFVGTSAHLHTIFSAGYRGPGFLTTLYPFIKLEYSVTMC
jgi:hypothetical protein